MNLKQLLQEIQNASFDPKITYTIEPLYSNEALILTEQEIETLVEAAIKLQPQVELIHYNDHRTRRTGSTEGGFPPRAACEHDEMPAVTEPATRSPLLTLLMSLGTGESFDPYIGQKDPRIETLIIQKAIERVQQLSKNALTEEAVFGITGNPPTLNHLAYIQHLLKRYPVLHLVLNAQSPLKDSANNVDTQTRLIMLQKMLEACHVDLNRCLIERLEIDRDPPSRMLATLALLALRPETQNKKLILILGMDGFLNFDHWYRWQDFSKLCHIKFYPREGLIITEEMLIEKLKCLLEKRLDFSFVYYQETQKKLYEQCFKKLGKLADEIILKQEAISTHAGSSTELRSYYQSITDTPDEYAQIPPNIHPTVHQYILAHRIFRMR